jgi:hypothetical protein
MIMKKYGIPAMAIIACCIFLMSYRQPIEQPATEYIIVSQCGIRKGLPLLQQSVNDLMKAGYQPQGGISVSESEISICYYQSMTR